jgi:hypothetical protein
MRLAELAFVRKLYRDAANWFREAETVEPGWIRSADDVQSLFAEPRDFAQHIARLESHLLANPQDRDGWLVLGSQWYLSGRPDRAADIFARLDDDRARGDVALIAFLDASKAHAKARRDAAARAGQGADSDVGQGREVDDAAR